MKIRAKFRCTSVESFEHGAEKVTLTAVTTGSDDNKQWSKYTPAGSVSMTITAEGANGQFKPGTEYFLEFTPAAEA